MPGAKFEFDSLCIFEVLTSLNFPLKKGRSYKVRIFIPGKWVSLKNDYYVQNRSSRPKIDPTMSISAIFKQRNFFSFSKFLRRVDEKRAAAVPLINQFC